MIILLRATFLHLCRNSIAHSVISYNGSSLALSHGPRMAGTGADAERQFTAGRYLEADSQQTAPLLPHLRMPRIAILGELCGENVSALDQIGKHLDHFVRVRDQVGFGPFLGWLSSQPSLP